MYATSITARTLDDDFSKSERTAERHVRLAHGHTYGANTAMTRNYVARDVLADFLEVVGVPRLYRRRDDRVQRSIVDDAFARVERDVKVELERLAARSLVREY